MIPAPMVPVPKAHSEMPPVTCEPGIVTPLPSAPDATWVAGRKRFAPLVPVPKAPSVIG